MQRKTYALIDGDQICKNVKNIIKNYPDYRYYFGVVKNNSYHHGIKTVIDMERGGINYFAVSSLEEALETRKYTKKPILCLEVIPIEFIDDVINNDITITIDSLNYVKKLINSDIYDKLKVHLAIDSGMRRLGFWESKSLKEAYLLLKDEKNIIIEGVYSHFATSGVMDPYYERQVEAFLDITKSIPLKSIPIVHMGRSLSLVNHPKLSFCNGIRLGIVMYGFSQSREVDNSLKGKIRGMKMRQLQKKYGIKDVTLQNDLDVLPAMKLYTSVMSERKVSAGDVVGYCTKKVEEDGYILTLPIGYADGVDVRFKNVSINGKLYPILADCMDMLMVFTKDYIEVGTEVEVFGDNIAIKDVCRNLKINAYHLFQMISSRILKVHVSKGEKEEIRY